MTEAAAESKGVEAEDRRVHLALESRPARLYGARYDHMPFPNIGPVQEVALDIGMTARHGAITLSGLVFKGYAEHQTLFEQRWPGRVIRQRVGEEDLHIPAQTGIAVRSLHFILHGYELLTMLEVTAIGEIDEGRTVIQSVLQIPVTFPELRTDLHFPLSGSWWAIQAADWSDQHKLEVFSQTFAIDFAALGPDNQTFRNNGMNLEDHYSWNQPVYATAGGKITHVSFDMPDMAPGVMADQRIFRDDPRRLLGNAVAISHANGEFSYFGHLRQASIQVNQGQVVRRGEFLGSVGSSGNSPGPHLHFHLMDGPNAFIDQGLPVKFSHFSIAGQFFDEPTVIPTRMVVHGPDRSGDSASLQHEGISMAKSRPADRVQDELVTRVDDDLYRELIVLTNQQIVHAIVWEDSLLDTIVDADASPETRSLFDIDIYLADGVFFELYGTLCYQHVDDEPLYGLAEVERTVATMLNAGLWLEDVAVDDNDSLVLIASRSRKPALYFVVCAWSLGEWSELPE